MYTYVVVCLACCSVIVSVGYISIVFYSIEITRFMSVNFSRAVLSELSQNTSKLSRSVNRGEEKLQYLRKTASERAKEAQQKLAELSQEIVEAEAFKMQVCIAIIRSWSFISPSLSCMC